MRLRRLIFVLGMLACGGGLGAPAGAASAKGGFYGAVMAWRVMAQSGVASVAAFDQFIDAVGSGQTVRAATFVGIFHACEKARDAHCVLLNALVLDDEGYLKRALDIAVPALALHPDLKLGVALARGGLGAARMEQSPENAAALLKAAAESLAALGYSKETGDARLNLALVLYLQDDFRGGDAWMAKGKAAYARAGVPVPSRYDEMAAKSRARQKDYKAALTLMQQATAKAAKEGDLSARVRTMGASAGLLGQLKRSAEGIRLLDQAITLLKSQGRSGRENMAALLENRAQLLAQAKRYAEARRDFLSAHQAYAAAGKNSDALGAFRAAASVTYALQGAGAALPMFQKLITLDPKGAGEAHAVRTKLAEGLAESGRCKEAMPHLEKAKKLSEKDKDGDVFSILLQKVVHGRCLRALGRSKEATEEFNGVLQVSTLLGLHEFTALVKKYGKGLKLNAENPLSALSKQLSALQELSKKPAAAQPPLSASPLLSPSQAVSGSPLLSVSQTASPADGDSSGSVQGAEDSVEIP